LKIEKITEAQILGGRSYLPLNQGRVTGRLRVVNQIESDTEDDLEPTDIVVLRETPLAIPPVAGVITERASTVLSHVNVLATGWGIPNAYVKDAATVLKAYDRQWVTLRVSAQDYACSLLPNLHWGRCGSSLASSARRSSRCKRCSRFCNCAAARRVFVALKRPRWVT
jgi:hypothetical protein